ncbi:MAG: tetraacyldisaccharide 4'-kinase, partial [Phycisphaerales bacterium]|nr:tetraacyldisaccharide 4'-kinase [Phycisphaerales bacterium]
VQPDRIAGLEELFATDAGKEIDCVVLDDGFQHRQIARDLDVVLIDASRPPDRDALLPQGYLREPVSALRRADCVVLTHTELVDDAEVDRIGRWVDEHTGSEPLANTAHRWASLDVIDSEAESLQEPGWLAGKRVFVVCAVGNPQAVRAGVEHLGGVVAGMRALADHQEYGIEEIRRINTRIQETNAEVALMTKKDWVKVEPDRLSLRARIVIPRLDLAFEQGLESFNQRVLSVL